MEITYERYLRWASTLVPHSKWWIDDKVFLQIVGIFLNYSGHPYPYRNVEWELQTPMTIHYQTVQIRPKRARRR